MPVEYDWDFFGKLFKGIVQIPEKEVPTNFTDQRFPVTYAW